MRILVTGSTGFVGGHMVESLVGRGHTPVCLVRSPENAKLPSGAELAQGDVTDAASVIAAASGVDAAIHLVGIIRETGGATFDAVHVQGTKNVLEAMKQAGVRRLLHMSAHGARPAGETAYYRTKWESEQIVRESGLDSTIFRPSIIFGRGDGFTEILVHLVRKAPVVPIIGSGESRYQPVFVGDVVSCFLSSLDDPLTTRKSYDLCGPDVITFEEYVGMVSSALGLSKPKIHIPTAVASLAVRVGEAVLPNPPLTADQLAMAQLDNVCLENAATDVFGLELTRLADVIKEIV